MELRQLVYFEAVARHGGFSRAAQHLRVAQPAVSAQVKQLERELGTPLLTRTTRSVALTHAGELLLSHTRAVLVRLDSARTELDELAAVVRGSLSVGATELLASLDLPGLLAGFHRRYPGVTLALRTGLVADLLGELDEGTVDVVVAPVHDDLPEKYVARPLAHERLVLITPPGFGAPRRLADVADAPFVCLREGSGLRAILSAAAAEAGFRPNIPFQTHSPSSIRELVAAGLGVALIAESIALCDGPDVDVHRLVNPPRHPPIGLIYPRGGELSAAARAWRVHVGHARRTLGPRTSHH